MNSSIRSKINGIPAWEHPKGPVVPTSTRLPPSYPNRETRQSAPPNTSMDHRALLQMGGTKPDHMLISFNSDSDSCCPSLGDLTMDLSEAQAFDSQTANNQQHTHPWHNFQQINRPNSPERKSNATIMRQDISPPKQRSKNQLRISAARENVSTRPEFSDRRRGVPPPSPTPVDRTNISHRTDQSRSIPPYNPINAHSSSSKPVLNTPGREVEFQLQGQLFQDVPADVDVSSIVAEKRRINAFYNTARNSNPSHHRPTAVEEIGASGSREKVTDQSYTNFGGRSLEISKRQDICLPADVVKTRRVLRVEQQAEFQPTKDHDKPTLSNLQRTQTHHTKNSQNINKSETGLPNESVKSRSTARVTNTRPGRDIVFDCTHATPKNNEHGPGDSRNQLVRPIRRHESCGYRSASLIEQEDEMMRLALERSLQDVGSHSRSTMEHSRTTNRHTSFQTESLSRSGSNIQNFDDVTRSEDDDDIDMGTALALSTAIMDDGVRPFGT